MPSQPPAKSDFELDRFVQAQDACRDQVLFELRHGRKTTHWMWFVFPQLSALGRSAMARHYGIGSREEAVAYVRHAVLGPRLLEGVGLVVACAPRSANEIFGTPDDLKFRSCVTLFGAVAKERAVFDEALRLFYAGRPDEATLALLGPG